MSSFPKIREALEYIDCHLDEPMSFEKIAGLFHFSPYYFHRMFSAVVGKPIAAHIRDRRLEKVCTRISATDETILKICMDNGFNSAQSFSRTFKNTYGLSPAEYRKKGLFPTTTSIEEMIVNFTNRLKGGIVVNPRIIKRNKILVAGVSGDGYKTGEVWQDFLKLNEKIGLANKESDNGYEIRVQEDDKSIVHVGLKVDDKNVDESFSLFELPETSYASFDVYVARGYDSENNAMNEWLEKNEQGYKERLLDGKHYVVEFYDERFNGEESDSIVEIWVPIEKQTIE